MRETARDGGGGSVSSSTIGSVHAARHLGELQGSGRPFRIANDEESTGHELTGQAFEGPRHRYRGYDLAGKERFHLLRGKSAWIQIAGGLAYAQIGEGKRIAVIDTATGRVLAKAEVDQPVTLVDDLPTLP